MATFDRDEFLQHVFHPKSVSRPTGIHHRTITGKGWKSSRVKSFNAFDAVKQEQIRSSGQLKSYLKGESTLKDARDNLRTDAIQKGYARPTRSHTIGEVVDKLFGFAVERPDRFNQGGDDFHADVSRKTIRERVSHMDKDSLAAAKGVSSYEELAELASDDNLLDEDGNNPFWYHDQ